MNPHSGEGDDAKLDIMIAVDKNIRVYKDLQAYF